MWQWFQDNYDLLIKKLPPGLSMLGNVVAMCTSSFTSQEKANEVRAFFEKVDTKGYDRSLAQALDSIQAKANWVERDAQDVETWLKERGWLNKEYQAPKL